MTIQTISSDPMKTRSSAKATRAATNLRDVNRCRVRPQDLIVHQGYSVLVTGVAGWIETGLEGFYLHQTRFLSRLRILVENAVPKAVSANEVDHHALIAYHLAPSSAGRAGEPAGEAAKPEDSEVIQKGIELQVNAFCGGGLHLDVTVTNHGLAWARVTMLLELAADFADLNEVLAGCRQQNGLVARRWRGEGGDGELSLRYDHPQLDLAARIVLRNAGEITDVGHGLACRLVLEPQRPQVLTLDLHPWFLGAEVAPFYGAGGCFPEDAPAAVARRKWVDGCQHVQAANPAVQSAWEQAVSDVMSLQVLDGDDAAPFMIVAGMPNYTGLFGRDAYLTALQSMILSPDTLRGALQVLPPLNAKETNDELDAEPGKVLHQRQLGPLAQLRISPFLHYYGDASTPGLYLLAAAAELANTGDVAFFRAQRDKLEGTLAWMAHNQDEAGFYPYQTRSSKGVKNQSWKDSGEAVLYPDGAMVTDPIAMADIQALYYAGKQALGLALLATGEDARGAALLDEAGALKRRFNDAFWMKDERYVAIALDSQHRQVRSIASDPGSCLAFGIIDDERTEAVADRLMSEEMFSGWGIRTLSSRHPAYNPFAYHLGTVWPSPNAVTAFGLHRYGFRGHMHRLASGLFAASQIFDLDRLPEVFGGHNRDAGHPHPGLYPGTCSPQAWSSGAVILLVNTMMGLMPFAPCNALFVDPHLPEWLPELTVRNVRVGASRVALRARRTAAGDTELDVLDAGGVRIVTPGSLPAGQDRLAAGFHMMFAAS